MALRKVAVVMGSESDLETMQLQSRMRLKVEYGSPSDASDSCQPVAQAGFLGSENQLIRVMVISGGYILWGYDNASSIYRVKVDDPKTLRLEGIPVDAYHQPRAKQWVTVHQTAVDMDKAGACIASPVGRARKVIHYDATTRTLELGQALPGSFLDSGRPVYLRLWESRHKLSGGTPVELVGPDGQRTGVRIRTKNTMTHGDYWMIGVRPSVPDAVFPERLKAWQPPDGPRRWIVPLAVIRWSGDPITAEVCDCRLPFDNLADLTERIGTGLQEHNTLLHGWGIVCGLQVR